MGKYMSVDYFTHMYITVLRKDIHLYYNPKYHFHAEN